jgi:hypothetical protein
MGYSRRGREHDSSKVGDATASKVGAGTLIQARGGVPASKVGGTTLTEQLGDSTGGDELHRIAAAGVAGPGGPLPHGDTIQRMFGRHDVSGIEAHVGSGAETATRALGAQAYATGHHVAFVGTPSLHTAAHEAAHVVQQRAGIQLKGGVGMAGDAHEQHADAVADLVVQGRSAEGLLAQYAQTSSGAGGAGQAAVQRQTPGDSSGPPASSTNPDAPPVKETAWNAKLDTSTDTLIQAFDKAGWNLDVITAKIAIGLKSSPLAYIEVIGNWQPDISKGTSSEIKEQTTARAATVRKALQQWGAFPDQRLRSTVRSMSIDGSAPPGSFHDIEVWFRTGTTTAAPPMVSGTTPAQPGPGTPPKPNALPTVPPETTKRMKDLGDLIAAAGDAATRDKLIKELRDLVIKIQPFLSDDEAKKTLNDAITSGVAEGIKAAIKAALEALAGKSATQMPADPSHTGPDVKPADLKEKIFKTPELPLPFDKPPEAKRFSFEFQSLKASYQPNAAIEFTLRTPDDFEPNGTAGAGRVVLLALDDYQKNGGLGADALAQKYVEAKGAVTMSLTAPEKAGAYVLAVRVGMEFREASREFKVAKP